MQKKRAFIRGKLAERILTQSWLRNELEDNGIIIDKTYLSSIINGNRNGIKAQEVLSISTKILEEYEKNFKKQSKKNVKIT